MLALAAIALPRAKRLTLRFLAAWDGNGDPDAGNSEQRMRRAVGLLPAGLRRCVLLGPLDVGYFEGLEEICDGLLAANENRDDV